MGSLSCQVMLQPVSGPLPSGLRFFRHPKPAPPKTDLAVCCPRRERYGVSTFRLFEFIGLGACSRPGDLRITRAEQIAALPISITFWFKRVSHFRLSMNNDLYRRFTCVHHTDYLALIRLVAARRVRLLRLIPRALRRFVALSGPLFIQAPRFAP